MAMTWESTMRRFLFGVTVLGIGMAYLVSSADDAPRGTSQSADDYKRASLQSRPAVPRPQDTTPAYVAAPVQVAQK